MRTISRLVLVFVVLSLAAGPALAGPLTVRGGPALSAPAEPAGSLGRLAALALSGGLAVVGAIKIKDTGALAGKFVTRATAAQGDYKTGVSQAGGDWETNTKNAEQSYEQGVTESISQKRFGKGVSGQGGKYQKNATDLGAQRYPGGIQQAQGAWATGVQPYLDTLKGLTLPPRGPRRSPANQARANMVALELGKKRTGQ